MSSEAEIASRKAHVQQNEAEFDRIVTPMLKTMKDFDQYYIPCLKTYTTSGNAYWACSHRSLLNPFAFQWLADRFNGFGRKPWCGLPEVKMINDTKPWVHSILRHPEIPDGAVYD